MRTTTLLAVVFLAGCRTASLTPMRVLVEPPAYAVSLSSTIGLGLTPIAEAPPGMKVRYLWTANGGFFLTQKETTNEIFDLGRETVTTGGKLFWSYEPQEQAELAAREVAITVVTVNAKSRRVIARTDMFLVWDGQLFRAKH